MIIFRKMEAEIEAFQGRASIIEGIMIQLRTHYLFCN